MSRSARRRDDAPRWYLGLTLLSLDGVQPFLPDIALPLTSPAGLIPIARDFVIRYRELDRDPNLEDEERVALRDEVVTSTVDEIVEVLGADGARRVSDWIVETLPYDTGVAAQSLVRRRTLARLASGEHGERRAALTSTGEEIFAGLLASYEMTTADLRRRVTEARTRSPSTWDAQTSATQLAHADAMDWVEDMAENVAVDSAWHQLVTSLPAPDRRTVVDLARAEANRLGIEIDRRDE